MGVNERWRSNASESCNSYINSYKLSSTLINSHQLLSTFINSHQLFSTLIKTYQLPLTLISSDQLLTTLNNSNQLSSTLINSHHIFHNFQFRIQHIFSKNSVTLQSFLLFLPSELRFSLVWLTALQQFDRGTLLVQLVERFATSLDNLCDFCLCNKRTGDILRAIYLY